jgi:hypothetical protein
MLAVSITPLDPIDLSKMRMEARRLKRAEKIPLHAAQDRVAQQAGFPHWRAAANSATSADADDPGALFSRALKIGASSIHLVLDAESAQMLIQVHARRLPVTVTPDQGNEVLQIARAHSSVLEIVSLPAATGRSGQTATVHAIHLRPPVLTLDALTLPPDARWVIDHWCESPLPGLMIVSGPARGRTYEQAAVAVYDHARTVAGSGSPRVQLASNPDRSGASALDDWLDRVHHGREKVVVPISAMNAEAILLRRFNGERKLPSELLFGPKVLTAVLHITPVPALCPACATSEPNAHTGDRNEARLATAFVAGLGTQRPKGVRFIGSGCSSCHFSGTAGIVTLVEAHGVIERSIRPAGNENEEARWMEDQPGNMQGIARSTIEGQLVDHVSAGRVDPYDAIRFP